MRKCEIRLRAAPPLCYSSVMIALLKELFLFLKETKMWWIAPILIILVLLSIFIFVTEGSAVLPFIYTLF